MNLNLLPSNNWPLQIESPEINQTFLKIPQMIPGNLLSKGTPILFVLLWSTGFIGAKLGMPHAEPMTFLSLRFLIAICFSGAFGVVVSCALAFKSLRMVACGYCWFVGPRRLPRWCIRRYQRWASSRLSSFDRWPTTSANWDPRWASVGRDAHKKEMDWTFLGISWGLDGCIGKTTQRKFLWDGFNLFRQPGTGLITLGTLYQKRFATKLDIRTGAVIQFISALTIFRTLVLFVRDDGC